MAPVEPYDTHAKMSPPLRSESDRQAIVGALSDGIIDAIAPTMRRTDCSRRAWSSSARDGVIGLETSLALTLGW